MCLDTAQLSAPVALEQRDPVVNRAQGFGFDADHGSAAFAPDGHQADVTQHLQVLRHRRLCHLERIDDIADRALVTGEELEDVPAPGFGDGVERV